MKRLSPIQGSILFFVLAPGTVAGVIPWLISDWQFHPAFLHTDVTRFLGAALVFAGLDIIVDCFARFATLGQGTPAPIGPTRTLVVSGFYRHVRNPMYVAVLATILGQGLLFAQLDLIGYAGIVWAMFHAFIAFYEEPVLKQSFGPAYDTYRANVSRWLPRWSPWQGEGKS
ncbi:MAG: isoprenylcysteine carboxylmethyltransferase family protein [Alphaproteobacteria bacterium]|nr:isoprenylcysteine carboxylmethyltransferase family protein [Alphaproteobacteria bacterium]